MSLALVSMVQDKAFYSQQRILEKKRIKKNEARVVICVQNYTACDMNQAQEQYDRSFVLRTNQARYGPKTPSRSATNAAYSSVSEVLP